MKAIIDFFRLIRITNLIIILITQVFAYYFLAPTIHLHDLFDPEFIRLLTATFLVAGAGYIINDYMDVKLDMVNKPGKVIVGKTISRRQSMFLHFTMNILAVGFALSISRKIALMVFLCAACLWIYSQLLKKNYLIGNLMVALLTSFTLGIIYMYDSRTMISGIWVYGIFAFGSTLLREIIKDTEDLRGDQKFKCRTLPIVLGVRKTKTILTWIQVVLIALVLSFCTAFNALSMSSNRIYVMFLVYMLIAVVLPMFATLWLIKSADVKEDFTRLSFLSKLIMLTGIISMVFWKF